jgi:hypothetical protein
MIYLYVYLILLIASVVLIYNGINISLKHAPPKIKLLSAIVICLFMLRMAALLLLFFVEGQEHLFLLKPLFFLNLPSVLIALIICTYIFIRSDRLSFSYVFGAAIIVGIIYVALIYVMPHIVQLSHIYGYSITFINQMEVMLGYISFVTVILVICILKAGNNLVNNLGLSLVIIACFAVIAETLLSLVKMEPFSSNIIGDVATLAVLNYAISLLKNRK